MAQMNELDDQYEFEIFNYVAGFLLYRKSFPERIEEGLPGLRKDLETPTINKLKHLMFKGPEGQASQPITGIYRRSFFRTLVDERFYRSDEWRDKPRGSRVVLVKDTLVGAKQEALKVL